MELIASNTSSKWLSFIIFNEVKSCSTRHSNMTQDEKQSWCLSTNQLDLWRGGVLMLITWLARKEGLLEYHYFCTHHLFWSDSNERCARVADLVGHSGMKWLGAYQSVRTECGCAALLLDPQGEWGIRHMQMHALSDCTPTATAGRDLSKCVCFTARDWARQAERRWGDLMKGLILGLEGTSGMHTRVFSPSSTHRTHTQLLRSFYICPHGK